MPWKNRSTTVVPEPDKDLEEKQKSPIRWAKFETQLIVEWFCTRDGNGVRVNYDLWTAENHSDAAEKMISHTGLIVKAGVTKKKTTDKMVDMIKQYKDVRHAIEQSRWSIAIGGVDVISHENRELQTGTSKTAKELIFKRCLWYYEYEEWYYDHPAVNPPAIIELEQPKCCDGQAVNNFELGCYDKDLHKGKSSPAASGRLSDQDGDEDIVQDIEDESDSSSLHPVLSQIAQEDRRAAKKQVKDVPESLSLSEEEISQANRQRSTPNPNSKSNKSTLTKAQPKKPKVSRHSKNQRSKRTRSNSPDSSKRGNSQPARKKRHKKTQLSMLEAIVQEAQILDQREREAAKFNDER